MLSGIKPTGDMHIGNYFGALKQWVDMQHDHDTFVFIPDYHALISVQDKEKMNGLIMDVAINLLSIGLDPEKVTLYKQSDVPCHTEACWIFNCLTTMPQLMRGHAFKDNEAKNKEVSVGLFDYPVLQTADIVLYDAQLVPVGEDQRQHIEMAREIVRKFKEEETKKYIMAVAMDSKGIEEIKNPDEYPLYEIARLFCNEEQNTELRAMFEQGGAGYGDIKKHVVDIVNTYLRPMRERRKELEKDPVFVKEVLRKGAEKAQAIANKKMEEVREKVGFNI